MHFRQVLVRLAKHGSSHSVLVVVRVPRVPIARVTTSSTPVLQAHKTDTLTASARTPVWPVAQATTAASRDLPCANLALPAPIHRQSQALAPHTV